MKQILINLQLDTENPDGKILKTTFEAIILQTAKSTTMMMTEEEGAWKMEMRNIGGGRR